MEQGYNNGVWGTDTVINNAGKHVITIPDCLEDGQYLLRAEMIALHGARSVNGAQLYMECAQINVTGGKGAQKPSTYSIPGIYKSSDPGLLINFYPMKGEYTIPGALTYVRAGAFLVRLLTINRSSSVCLHIVFDVLSGIERC